MYGIFNQDSRESTAKAFEEPVEEQLTPEQIEANALEETNRLAAEEIQKQQDNLSEEEKQKLADDKKIADEKALLDGEADAEKTAAARKAWLADLGFESEDQLRDLKAKASVVVKTPEQIAQDEEKYQVDLLAYSVKEGLLNRSDIAAYDKLNSMEDNDVVFDDFKTTYLAENKDRKLEGTDEPDPVSPEEIKEAFNQLYHIDSPNSVLKAKGEKMLKGEAEFIKGESTQKFSAAKEKYDLLQSKLKIIPEYKSFVQGTLAKAIPEELVVFGEGDDKVVFKLTDASGKPLYDAAEIEKLFVDNKLFGEFSAGGDKAKLAEFINKTVTDHIWDINKAAINKLVYDQGKEIGLKNGSTTGANAPFQGNAPKPVLTSDKVMSEGQTQQIRSRYGKLV